MTGNHYQWPLFCDDISQAQQWICEQLSKHPTDKQLGHQALSLGMTDAVQRLLYQGDLNLKEARRQYRFRLARLNGEKNPYSELIPPDVQAFTDLQMDHAKRMNSPVVVSLIGGIGDHVEMISLLVGWNRTIKHQLELIVTPERYKALSQLIKAIPEITLGTNVHPRAIQSMAVREWIFRQNEQTSYNTWIMNESKNHRTVEGTLCCWKAKGAENLLSAYLRSVPFQIVLDFYKKKKQQVPEAEIIDISEWTSKEISLLEKAGVKCINPKNVGMSGLIDACRGKEIITIDTALAHLCAAMGKRATLLLNYCPDERWVELLRPENCYAKHLNIHHQTKFYDWEEAVSTLLTCSSS